MTLPKTVLQSTHGHMAVTNSSRRYFHDEGGGIQIHQTHVQSLRQVLIRFALGSQIPLKRRTHLVKVIKEIRFLTGLSSLPVPLTTGPPCRPYPLQWDVFP